MLKNDYNSNSDTSNSFNNVPVGDLPEVVKLAVEMQEAERLQHEADLLQREEVRTDEQIRQATIKTAKEMGVTEDYLHLAAEQLQHVREQRADARDRCTRVVITIITIFLLSAIFIVYLVRLYGHS